MACWIYLRFAEHLLSEQIPSKIQAYQTTREDSLKLWEEIEFTAIEQQHFDRIIHNDITSFPLETIRSGGYVIDSLEAAMWCFLNFDNYKEAVLQAVNLGEDTDTTAAITGGLAGLYYGIDAIPQHWLLHLARLEDIIQLSVKLNSCFKS